MKGPRRIEDTVKEMSFVAGPEMDRRPAPGRHDNEGDVHRRSTSRVAKKPIWRILMNTKIVRVGVAAVVVVGALARGRREVDATEAEDRAGLQFRNTRQHGAGPGPGGSLTAAGGPAGRFRCDLERRKRRLAKDIAGLVRTDLAN